MISIITVFLGIVAGISLLVGGINVMNIMLVTITERTREIGLRKATGAQNSDIVVLFLVQAVVMTADRRRDWRVDRGGQRGTHQCAG